MRQYEGFVSPDHPTTKFGRYQEQFAPARPGPLARALRVLQRVRCLLDEPKPAELPRHVANGIFEEDLFSRDNDALDDFLDCTETLHGFGGVLDPDPVPTLGEEWISLVDRTFLRMRRALQKPDLGTVIGGRSYGPYDEQPAAPDFATLQAIGHVEHQLGSIDRHLGSISYTLETIAEHIYKRTTEPVARPAADDGDVSPPADASPPGDYDDGDRGDNL